jgi:microcystin-dependent protein
VSSVFEERTGQGRLGAPDDRPLTDQEYQLLQRLLGDPFSLPMPFKTWLISYLEASDLSLPFSAVQGLSNVLGLTGAGAGVLGSLPAGLIFPYGGTTPPTGSKLCDGASYSTTTEARLFAAIGYSYGGSGGNFNVPDIRGRIPVMLGQSAETNALGKSDGAAVGVRGPKHTHTVTDPQHTHGQGALQDVGQGAGSIMPQGVGFNASSAASQFTVVGSATGISVGVGGQQDTPAFLTVNFIIVS